MPKPSPALATRVAICAASILLLADCTGAPAARRPLQNGPIAQPRNEIDAFAYDRPTGSVTLAAPEIASRAVPARDTGNGRMIASTSQADSLPAGKPTVVMNLSSVPLQQAAKTVLGDLIGVNYTIDPRVDGTISVQTVNPVSKSDALEMFQSALAPIGATITSSRGIYRIGPTDQAFTGNIGVADGLDTQTAAGTNVKVVPLKFVSATEVARVIEPMVPKGAIVQADDARGIIAVRGSPAELETMLSSIAIFDVDVMRGMSFGIVPVKTAQPEKLADELKAVFASSKEGPLKGRVNFIPNARLGAILVVTSQPAYLPRAETWIKRLDAKATGTDPRLHVYAVQNRPARELARILQRMFADETKSGADGETGVSPRSRAVTLADPNSNGNGNGNLRQPASGTSSSLANAFRNASGGQAPDGLSNSRSADTEQMEDSSVYDTVAAGPSKEPRMRIVADDAKNSLVIMANARDYERVSRLLQTIDVAANQVMIEAAIAEVTLNDDLQYGVEWALKNGNSTGTFANIVNSGLNATMPGFSYAFRAANIATTLSALNSLTDVNVISTPSLMVLDNKTATLQIGDQVPITTQTAANTATSNVAIVNSVSMRDTGVILSVTPRVNENGRVQLDIEQEVSSVVKTTTSNIDSPTIQQRRVKTTVVVNDGEVLALGGMIQDQVSRTSAHIPILGDLPGVGGAFGSRGNVKKKTELIILITPRVARDRAESRQITEEYRRKINVYMPHGATAKQRSPANTVRRIVQQ